MFYKDWSLRYWLITRCDNVMSLFIWSQPLAINLRLSSDAVLHVSRIECWWGRTKDFSHLHSIRLTRSTASELGLSSSTNAMETSLSAARFHLVVLQRTAKKRTKIQSARAQPLFCSLMDWWHSRRRRHRGLLKLPNGHMSAYSYLGSSLPCRSQELRQ